MTLVMLRIRRWIRRRGRRTDVVWSEPALPPYIKLNPDAGPATGGEGWQPGDISMGLAAQEFLEADEPEAE